MIRGGHFEVNFNWLIKRNNINSSRGWLFKHKLCTDRFKVKTFAMYIIPASSK